MSELSPRESSNSTARQDLLLLADWRRQIATLYSEVRSQAIADPREAWAHWHAHRERLFREHPQSPVPVEQRATFRARHFAYDPMLRFELPVEDVRGAGEVESEQGFRAVGQVVVPFADRPRTLEVFWTVGYGDGLFLPFRDRTNGQETYGGGRYLLDGAKSADLGGDPMRGTLLLDFNFAYHPSCAFDPRWTCPLAPPENWLDIAVHGGERLR